MAGRSSFEMVNRAFHGTLPDRLRQMRTDGLTLEQMHQKFQADEWNVSLETVRRWCKRAGVPTHRVAAPVEP